MKRTRLSLSCGQLLRAAGTRKCAATLTAGAAYRYCSKTAHAPLRNNARSVTPVSRQTPTAIREYHHQSRHRLRIHYSDLASIDLHCFHHADHEREQSQEGLPRTASSSQNIVTGEWSWSCLHTDALALTLLPGPAAVRLRRKRTNSFFGSIHCRFPLIAAQSPPTTVVW